MRKGKLFARRQPWTRPPCRTQVIVRIPDDAKRLRETFRACAYARGVTMQEALTFCMEKFILETEQMGKYKQAIGLK